jgi:hypothetical protein
MEEILMFKFNRYFISTLVIALALGLVTVALAAANSAAETSMNSATFQQGTQDPDPDPGTNRTEAPGTIVSTGNPKPTFELSEKVKEEIKEHGFSASVPLTFGQVITSFPVLAGGTPVGLEHDGSGNLYITDLASENVYLIDTSGTVITSFSSVTETLNGLGITTDGNALYINDSTDDDVDSYTLNGTYITSFSVLSETTFPEGITYNPDTGNLYVVDGDSNGPDTVNEYNISGTLIMTYTLATNSTDGIAYDPVRCTYWIYDSDTDAVRHYTPDLVNFEAFPGTANAGFANGEGVGIIEDTLYVVATGSDTIVAFDVSDASTLFGNQCGEVGTLTGQVTSANTGQALPNAFVFATDGFYSDSSLSNAAGEYTLTLRASSYTVTANLFGYVPGEATGVEIISGTTTVQDFPLAKGELTGAPEVIEEWLTLGTSVTNQIILSNTGTTTLTVSVRDLEELLGDSSPDAFGYTLSDQDSPACNYDYVDISSTGLLVASGDDASSINSGIFSPISMPESINIYGQDIYSMVLATNGYLTTDFADGGPDLSNDCPLPATPSTPGGTDGLRLYPLHDDLVTDEGLYEYFADCPRTSDYGISEGCSVYQWHNVTHFGGAITWTQQTILYHTSNEIVHQIGPGNPELGTGSTTGLQDFAPPTAGLTYACNTFDSIPDNTAVCIYPPVDPPWAIENPMTGTIAAGEALNMDVIFDSSFVSATGTYTAELIYEGDYENVVSNTLLIMHVSTSGVAISADQTGSGPANTQVAYQFTITNTGLVADSFDISLSGNAWATSVNPLSTGSLVPGASTTVEVTVDIPISAPASSSDTVVITATSAQDSFVKESATAHTSVWDSIYLPLIRKN